MSQAELARVAGITRQALGAIESGRAQPGVTVALAIARAVGSSVEELFGQTNGSRIQAEMGVAPASPRAAVAFVGGRVVARALADPGQRDAASALVSGFRNGRAELEPLSAQEEWAATVFLAGCEPALGLLAGHVKGAANALWFPSTNRDAIAEFAAGRLHVAAVHGSNAELERLMRRIGGEEVDVFELATIEEGWIVAGGNPLKLRGAHDLERNEVRLANRSQGSAARALLDAELRRAGIQADGVSGYRRALQGHADVARAVAFGYADIGIGVAGVADAFKLGFIPLRSERCILIVRRRDRMHTGVTACVAALRSTAFRRDLAAFGPYDTTHIGESI
jgi:molybdate-binding protein/DNA-binding XRE family transcriptional regulator